MKQAQFDWRQDATMTLAELQAETQRGWGGVVLFHARINDEEKNRFTDCWVDVIIKHGRPVFRLNHERGYPSENKGTTVKTITTSWVSNELPKV